jgi:hypothetical protein
MPRNHTRKKSTCWRNTKKQKKDLNVLKN